MGMVIVPIQVTAGGISRKEVQVGLVVPEISANTKFTKTTTVTDSRVAPSVVAFGAIKENA